MNMFCYSRPSSRSLSRLAIVIGQALLSLWLIHAGGLAKAADFTVRTVNDEYNYTINGVINSPPLTLIRGQTYTFDISACSCHPFVINDASGNMLAGSFITNNNTYSGTIVFTVPTAAVNYQYRCSLHVFGNVIRTLASLPPLPVCTTGAASNVGSDGATLTATVNGKGAATGYSFIYGTDPTLQSGTTTTSGQATSTLSTNVSGSFNLTGLLPLTTYYYRAQATNIAGTTTGSIVSFTTLSNNADLSSLTLSSGTLAPSFSSGTTSYSASVSNATSSITLTPTVADSNATVTVNDVTVASGSASGSIALSVGPNTITTVVTAQDGIATQTYTVTVTRAASLPTVTTPTSTAVTSLTATLGGNVTSDGGVTVSARGVVYSVTATNSNPQLGGTGVTSATTSGTTGVFTVPVSSLTPGTAYSFAAYATNSGGTSYTSVGTFTTLSNNASLSNLTLSSGMLAPVFSSGTASYSASVSNATGSVTLTPTVADGNATVTVNGVTVTSGSASAAISLTLGSNVITTIVTAQDGTTTQTYTVTVTRRNLLEDWRQTWFGTASNTGSAADIADPEHDGIPNYLEFATNSNPTSSSSQPGHVVVVGSNIEFTYTRSKAAMTYGVTFTVEWSDTMLAGSWTSAATSEAIISEDSTVQNVKATLPAGTNGHRFVHLSVAGP